MDRARRPAAASAPFEEMGKGEPMKLLRFFSDLPVVSTRLAAAADAPFQARRMSHGVIDARTAGYEVPVGWTPPGISPAGVGFPLRRSPKGGATPPLNGTPHLIH